MRGEHPKDQDIMQSVIGDMKTVVKVGVPNPRAVAKKVEVRALSATAADTGEITIPTGDGSEEQIKMSTVAHK
jgi:hypothetical protein